MELKLRLRVLNVEKEAIRSGALIEVRHIKCRKRAKEFGHVEKRGRDWGP